MQTLSLEGQRHDVRVDCLAPSAATRTTADIMTPDTLEQLLPDAVSPTVVALAAYDAPSGSILRAGAGSVERAFITSTRGLRLAPGPDAAGPILSGFELLSDRTGEMVPASGPEQAQSELASVREPSEQAV